VITSDRITETAEMAAPSVQLILLHSGLIFSVSRLEKIDDNGSLTSPVPLDSAVTDTRPGHPPVPPQNSAS